jgi:hypothetical protein
MKLTPPLSNLIARCQTICVAECCGVDAYDFSPVQIASYLTMSRGTTDQKEVAILEEQLTTLKTNYGSRRASGGGVVVEEMNQSFTAEAVDSLAEEITANLKVAVELAAESERRRFKPKNA